MGREWKPGDVAMVRVSSEYPPEVAVSSDRQWFVAGPRLGSRHGWYHDHVEAARPLVVIDPEDAEQVERLTTLFYSERSRGDRDLIVGGSADAMQAALREFADPRIEEPTGLGAVVVDVEGIRWTRVEAGTAKTRNPWYPADAADFQPDEWFNLCAVEILSEGVQ